MRDEALVKNYGDEEQVKAGRKQEKISLDLHKEVFRTVLSTREGRATMWFILSQLCRLNEQSYVRDSDMSIFKEGRRSVGTQLIFVINESDRNAYWKMAQEAAEEKEND